MGERGDQVEVFSCAVHFQHVGVIVSAPRSTPSYAGATDENIGEVLKGVRQFNELPWVKPRKGIDLVCNLGSVPSAYIPQSFRTATWCPGLSIRH